MVDLSLWRNSSLYRVSGMENSRSQTALLVLNCGTAVLHHHGVFSRYGQNLDGRTFAYGVPLLCKTEPFLLRRDFPHFVWKCGWPDSCQICPGKTLDCMDRRHLRPLDYRVPASCWVLQQGHDVDRGVQTPSLCSRIFSIARKHDQSRLHSPDYSGWLCKTNRNHTSIEPNPMADGAFRTDLYRTDLGIFQVPLFDHECFWREPRIIRSY